jgi:hypothetical protein
MPWDERPGLGAGRNAHAVNRVVPVIPFRDSDGRRDVEFLRISRPIFSAFGARLGRPLRDEFALLAGLEARLQITRGAAVQSRLARPNVDPRLDRKES